MLRHSNSTNQDDSDQSTGNTTFNETPVERHESASLLLINRLCILAEFAINNMVVLYFINGLCLLTVAAGGIAIAWDCKHNDNVHNSVIILCVAALLRGHCSITFFVKSFYSAVDKNVPSVDDVTNMITAMLITTGSCIALCFYQNGLAFAGTIAIFCGEATYLLVNIIIFLERWNNYCNLENYVTKKK